MPELFVNPAFKGYVVPSDLLRTNVGFEFITRRDELLDGHERLFFRIKDDRFTFYVGCKNSTLILRRQDVLLRLPISDLPENEEWVFIKTEWNFNNLLLRCTTDGYDKAERKLTVLYPPPSSLVTWARKQQLLPIAEYKSAEDFRSRVYSCLDSIQDKVDEAGAVNPFWDVRYSKNSIVKRSPKNEVDIHPTIRCLLADQMLMAGIEVIPEYKTGIGNLDFMFIGKLYTKDSVKLCAEFKLAHSKDVSDGFKTQLPMYMRNTNTEYGAYCILGFKGEWFEKPRQSLIEIDRMLAEVTLSSVDPLLRNIRVFTFDFSKPTSASKI